MKYLVAIAMAVSVLVGAFLLTIMANAEAVQLSQDQCYQGANITALAALERDKKVSEADLLAQVNKHRSEHSADEYEIIRRIVADVYSMPESTPQQLAEMFVNECFATKGKMNIRT